VRRLAVRLSTRSQLKGTITQVDIGSVMAIVKIRLNGGDQVVTASVTKDAALELSLKEGRACNSIHQVN
jgi:molybdopterin-binding protein